MIVAHLTASTFYGGPERQMLGLARELSPCVRSVFYSFSEGGQCRDFFIEVRRHGFVGHELEYDTPWLRAAARELTDRLKHSSVDVLCCHGYKANLIGRIAARRRGIPAVAVSRGWTGESFKVRLYEAADRLHLRWMDRVVCVSEGQANRVLGTGVNPSRVSVIHNAIDVSRFTEPDLRYLRRLHETFPRPRRCVVASAGRLSPEKGFDVLVEAAARLVAQDPTLGFIHFGDGPDHARIAEAIRQHGLQDVFLLAGLRTDLDLYYPFFDVLVLPSYTEGLPNVVLEAFAARVPVVATAVGGTPELVKDAVNGYLVTPGDVDGLAARISTMLDDDERRLEMGRQGYLRVQQEFTFAAQARAYARLFSTLVPNGVAWESALVESESEQESVA